MEVTFLFGARDNHEELLFGDFLTQFFEGNTKNKLFLACSREIEENQISSLENVSTYNGYVQDTTNSKSVSLFRRFTKIKRFANTR